MQVSIVAVLLIFFLCSCTDSRIRYAKQWTKEIKTKIMEDAGRQPDSSHMDTSRPNIRVYSYYKDGSLLRSIGIDPATNDTFYITSFSADQNFILGRELCPLLKDHYVEVILYKGKMTLGEHTSYYCNGKIKSQGMNISGLVGKWTEYDEAGRVWREKDHGNLEKLDTLRKIKYYR